MSPAPVVNNLFPIHQDGSQDQMKISHVGSTWHLQPMFQSLARLLRGQVEQFASMTYVQSLGWSASLHHPLELSCHLESFPML